MENIESDDLLFESSVQPANHQGGTAGGLTVMITAVFLIGEMAGSGVLALPKALANAGWIGVLLIVACCLASGYNGVNLGRCWNILLERYPEYHGRVRYPYPAIGQRAVGRWMGVIVSICVDITLFGVCTVFILIAAQNIQSLLLHANVHVSSCYWLIVLAAILTPLTWLGTPKDFWPIAIVACSATGVACLLSFISMMLDISESKNATHSSPKSLPVFMAFGTILFSFGGASTFPTIQHDMKEPSKFPLSVIWAYLAILCMYLPVSIAGYAVYGDNLESNVLQNLPSGGLRIAAEVCITMHLIFAFVIALNPLSQHIEDVCRIEHRFGWKRCLLRTIIVVAILFVAESIPHFGALLDLIGASTVTFLTFVAPSLFYLCLCAQKGEWEERHIPLHVKVIMINLEIMLVGVVGGVASTYSAIKEMTSPDTFIPPCYINVTAADA